MNEADEKALIEQLKQVDDNHPRTAYGFRLGFQAALAHRDKQAEPLAWAVIYFGGKFNGRIYTTLDSEAHAKDYVANMHQSQDQHSFRFAPIYTHPAPAVAQEPVATVYEIGRHMSIVLTAHGKSVLTHNQKLYAEPRAVSEPRTHVDDAAQKLDKLLGQVINRRVMVEQKLFDMAAGKLPMPDADGLRKLAMELGDPAHNRPASAQEPVLLVDHCEFVAARNEWRMIGYALNSIAAGTKLYTEAPAVAVNEQLLEALRLIRGKHGCGALTLPQADLERVDAAIAAAEAAKGGV